MKRMLYVEKRYSEDGKDKEYVLLSDNNSCDLSNDSDLLGYRLVVGNISVVDNKPRYIMTDSVTPWVYVGKRMTFEEFDDLAHEENNKEYLELLEKMELNGIEEVVVCKNGKVVFINDNDFVLGEYANVKSEENAIIKYYDTNNKKMTVELVGDVDVDPLKIEREEDEFAFAVKKYTYFLDTNGKAVTGHFENCGKMVIYGQRLNNMHVLLDSGKVVSTTEDFITHDELLETQERLETSLQRRKVVKR